MICVNDRDTFSANEDVGNTVGDKVGRTVTATAATIGDRVLEG